MRERFAETLLPNETGGPPLRIRAYAGGRAPRIMIVGPDGMDDSGITIDFRDAHTRLACWSGEEFRVVRDIDTPIWANQRPLNSESSFDVHLPDGELYNDTSVHVVTDVMRGRMTLFANDGYIAGWIELAVRGSDVLVRTRCHGRQETQRLHESGVQHAGL